MSGTPYPNGIYNGRMEADGSGNLLASEGEYAGYPIAFHDGSFVFVQPGEPSHNERHHVQFAKSMTVNGEVDTISSTVDASQIPPDGDASLVNSDESTNPHHYGVLPDDPHYEEGVTTEAGRVTNTKAQLVPDTIAPRMTGHTATVSAPDDTTGGGG